jgi:hypothetical protein
MNGGNNDPIDAFRVIEIAAHNFYRFQFQRNAFGEIFFLQNYIMIFFSQ